MAAAIRCSAVDSAARGKAGHVDWQRRRPMGHVLGAGLRDGPRLRQRLSLPQGARGRGEGRGTRIGAGAQGRRGRGASEGVSGLSGHRSGADLSGTATLGEAGKGRLGAGTCGDVPSPSLGVKVLKSADGN